MSLRVAGTSLSVTFYKVSDRESYRWVLHGRRSINLNKPNIKIVINHEVVPKLFVCVWSVDAMSFSSIDRSNYGFPYLREDNFCKRIISFLGEVHPEVRLELLLRPHVPIYLRVSMSFISLSNSIICKMRMSKKKINHVKLLTHHAT